MARKRDPALAPDLDSTAVAVFERARTQLEEQGTWKSADVELLACYARSLQTARMARARIDERLKAEGEFAAFYSYGSARQLTAHPDVTLARQCEGDAERYAASLLLTPQARKRAGIDGVASLEDEFAAILKEGP